MTLILWSTVYTFIDLCGHERYIRTTVHGMTVHTISCSPDRVPTRNSRDFTLSPISPHFNSRIHTLLPTFWHVNSCFRSLFPAFPHVPDFLRQHRALSQITCL